MALILEAIAKNGSRRQTSIQELEFIEKGLCTMSYLEIEKVIGREIIDSRGNPTVEAEVWLADGTIGRGAAPI